MRKSFPTLVPVLVLAFMLSGCIGGFGGGKAYTPENVSENLKPGVTTKEQVRDKYGEPTTIKTSKKGDAWIYVDEPSENEKTAGGLVGALGSPAVYAGSNKVNKEVSRSSGSVAGTVAGTGTSVAGNAATGAVVEHTSRDKATLIINFDKNGTVSTYDIK